jgi:peptidoglycan/xylan/chitin deacetylase (PgdA/CDA1 family)
VSFRHARRRLAIAAGTRLGLDSWARRVERRQVAREGGPIVRVLFLHGTSPLHQDTFRRHLAWLREHFTLIEFSTFKGLFDGTAALPAGRPAAMLTFDDGFLSNYLVAAPLLEAVGTRGLFFVIPGFSACAGDREARRFYRTRIRPVRPPFFERPMTPQQIRELADRGHTIGNHTFSHAYLPDTGESEYHHEIIESAAVLESWTQRPVEAFAWPFKWNGITPAAHRLAAARHSFCFAACHGRVEIGIDSPRLLWRSSVEAHHTAPEWGFQCSALGDAMALVRRRHLARLLDLEPTRARPLTPPTIRGYQFHP